MEWDGDISEIKATHNVGIFSNRFSQDFGGQEKEILEWVLNYLEGRNAKLLKTMLGDRDPITIVYQDYDWSGNL